MSEASSTSHEFIKKHFNSPTWCVTCKHFIWGISSIRGLQCKHCTYTAHKKCQSKIEAVCPRVPFDWWVDQQKIPPQEVENSLWLQLPSDILQYICSFLSIKEILKIETVCKSWKKIIQEGSSIWKSLCQKIDPTVHSLPDNIISTWKGLYKNLWYVVVNVVLSREHTNGVYISLNRDTYNEGEFRGSLKDPAGMHVEKGESCIIRVPSPQIIYAQDPMTVEVWFWPTNFHATTFRNSIFSQHSWGTGYELRGNDSTAEFLITTGEGHQVAQCTRSHILKKNQWNHLAGVFSKNTIYLYVNGKKEGKLKLRSKNLAQATESYIELGRNIHWLDRFFIGYIATARLTRRALSPPEFLPQPTLDPQPEQIPFLNEAST